MRGLRLFSSRHSQALEVLVRDDRIHSIPEPAFRPQGCDLGPKFQREQRRVENPAVEVDPRARGIAAVCSLFGMEGGVPEIVVDVVGPDAMLGDAQLPRAPAGMEFEPVIPVLGKLSRMLRRVGRNGFGLGKQTCRLN
jgi:hypothetical protein